MSFRENGLYFCGGKLAQRSYKSFSWRFWALLSYALLHKPWWRLVCCSIFQEDSCPWDLLEIHASCFSSLGTFSWGKHLWSKQTPAESRLVPALDGGQKCREGRQLRHLRAEDPQISSLRLLTFKAQHCQHEQGQEEEAAAHATLGSWPQLHGWDLRSWFKGF